MTTLRVGILLITSCSATAWAQTPRYSIQSFDDVGGDGASIVGTDLNNNGVVLGVATSSIFNPLAFGPWMYDQATGIHELTPLWMTEQYLFANVLNDHSKVAGSDMQLLGFADGDGPVDLMFGLPLPVGYGQAVSWDDPGVAPFAPIPGLPNQTGEPFLGNFPYGINNAGAIVGQSVDGTNPFFGTSRAFLFRDGRVEDLSGVAGPGTSATIAIDINEPGQVCGIVSIDGVERVFVLDPRAGTTILPPMVDPSGGTEMMRPIAMNDQGQIVGVSEVYVPLDPNDPSLVQVEPHGFLWDGQAYEDLGGVYPIDINNLGQIAGSRAAAWEYGAVTHAVVRLDREWIDLNDIMLPQSCRVLARAQAINDAGQILAVEHWCQQSVFIHHRTYLFTPLEACPSDVTEDGVVDVDDLFAVILAWGPCQAPAACAADIAPIGALDGEVNIDDLFAVINAWGACD